MAPTDLENGDTLMISRLTIGLWVAMMYNKYSLVVLSMRGVHSGIQYLLIRNIFVELNNMPQSVAQINNINPQSIILCVHIKVAPAKAALAV